MNIGTVVSPREGVSINGCDIAGLRGRIVDLQAGDEMRFVRFPANSTRAEFFVWIRTADLKVVV